MKVAPVVRYHQPRFPTRNIIDQHPELLRLVPKRWRNKPLVLGTLAAVCTLSAGYWSQANAKGMAARIAPIFQHGNGHGTFGCIVVNPPVLLSEADANQVIREEVKRAGLDFSKTDKIIRNVEIPTTDFSQKNPVGPVLKPKDLVLDGTDPKKNISFEYISTDDINKWHSNGLLVSTVETFDTVGVAKQVRNGLVKAHPPGAIGVFYDPMAGIDQQKLQELFKNGGWEAARQEMTAKTKEELRAQVQDFVKWLKAQGVI
jgi:hypothetical protein